MTEIGAFHSANPFFLVSQVAIGDRQLYFKSLLTTCRKQGQCGDEDPKGSMVGRRQTIFPDPHACHYPTSAYVAVKSTHTMPGMCNFWGYHLFSPAILLVNLQKLQELTFPMVFHHILLRTKPDSFPINSPKQNQNIFLRLRIPQQYLNTCAERHNQSSTSHNALQYLLHVKWCRVNIPCEEIRSQRLSCPH